MKHNKINNFILCFLAFILMLFSVNALEPVDLGTAGNFVILTKSGISTTGTTSIVGDIGVSPIDSTAITGFDLILDPLAQYGTSSLINGKVYASDYSQPTPTKMTVAISDMETAYTDAAGRTLPDYTELGAGNIGGMTLTPGLYKWGTDVIIPTDVTLLGNSNDVWIFQIAQNLDISNGKQIHLTGGADAKNVFWQVGGQTTLGTTSVFNGVILSQTAIVLNTGATLNGKALAQTSVTLDANTVSSANTKSSSNTITSNTDVNLESNKSNSESSSSETNWECSEWTKCNEEGISMQTCTKPNITPFVKKQSCTSPIQIKNEINVDENKNNLEQEQNNNDDNLINKNQVNSGIGQELNNQISERKENIISGEYTNMQGQLLKVKELTENLKELRVNEISAKTNLNITAETNFEKKTKLKIMLKNGHEKEIKIMPDVASEIALEKLKMKNCSIENNCTIQLKDVGSGDGEKIQYEIQIERHSKILGIFQKKIEINVAINAENGNVKIHKPWWAFMATEPAE